jgi:uncharacterized membrane protein YuzA (DUF378 family)
MDEVNLLDWASLTLIIVGAVNWGLVGLGKLAGKGEDAYNIVHLLLEQTAGLPEAEAAVYLLVGLSGLYQVYFGYQLYEEKIT